MSAVKFPEGLRLETLQKGHPRKSFQSGEPMVDDWLVTKALQQQKKHLSVTKVLLDEHGSIAGYYTLAIGQIDFADLPVEETKHLPRRQLPVAILAWFGIAQAFQGQGLGDRLLARAILDCYEAGKTFAFVALMIDCLSDAAKSFYRRWKFEELPVNRDRLFLRTALLEAAVETE